MPSTIYARYFEEPASFSRARYFRNRVVSRIIIPVHTRKLEAATTFRQKKKKKKFTLPTLAVKKFRLIGGLLEQSETMDAPPLDAFQLIGGENTLFRRKASVYFHSFPRPLGAPPPSVPLYENSLSRANHCRNAASHRRAMYFSHFSLSFFFLRRET